MRGFFALLTAYVLLGCQGHTLNQGSSKRNIELNQYIGPQAPDPSIGTNPNPTPTIEKTTGNGSGDGALAPIPDTAVLPVPIGGSNLLCFPREDFSCLATDEAGLPLAFVPVKAFYATSLDNPVWTETSFVSLANSGSWPLAIPLELKDQIVSVLLIDERSQYVLTQTVKAQAALKNLVVDGSFEAKAIDPANIEITRELLPAAQIAWQSRLSDPSANCQSLLELSSVRIKPEETAADGEQWVELTAPCELGLGSNRTTLGISQTLELVEGHQYFISFNFRRSSRAQETALQFSMGGEVLFDRKISEQFWTPYQGLFVAQRSTYIIDFLEKGSLQGGGTAIDGVVVYDLDEAETAPVPSPPILTLPKIFPVLPEVLGTLIVPR